MADFVCKIIKCHIPFVKFQLFEIHLLIKHPLNIFTCIFYHFQEVSDISMMKFNDTTHKVSYIVGGFAWHNLCGIFSEF